MTSELNRDSSPLCLIVSEKWIISALSVQCLQEPFTSKSTSPLTAKGPWSLDWCNKSSDHTDSSKGIRSFTILWILCGPVLITGIQRQPNNYEAIWLTCISFPVCLHVLYCACLPCVGRYQALCVAGPVLRMVVPFLLFLLAGILVLAAGSCPCCFTHTYEHRRGKKRKQTRHKRRINP